MTVLIQRVTWHLQCGRALDVFAILGYRGDNPKWGAPNRQAADAFEELVTFLHPPNRCDSGRLRLSKTGA